MLMMNVSRAFETFLQGLERPMKLNEMRVMREENYLKFRETVVTKFLADPVLEVMRDNQKALGLDPDIFDLVYEGFWDIYCMRPRCDGITTKAIQLWNNKFILQVNPDDDAVVMDEGKKGAADSDEEEKPDAKADEEDDIVS